MMERPNSTLSGFVYGQNGSRTGSTYARTRHVLYMVILRIVAMSDVPDYTPVNVLVYLMQKRVPPACRAQTGNSHRRVHRTEHQSALASGFSKHVYCPVAPEPQRTLPFGSKPGELSDSVTCPKLKHPSGTERFSCIDRPVCGPRCSWKAMRIRRIISQSTPVRHDKGTESIPNNIRVLCLRNVYADA